MKIIVALFSVVLLTVAAIAGYQLGVSVGQSRAAEAALVSKLSDAFLAETIVRSLEAQSATSTRDSDKAQRALLLQLADSLKFYADRLNADPDLRPATTVCAAVPQIEAHQPQAPQSEKGGGSIQDAQYVREAFATALAVLRGRCSLEKK